MILYYVTKRILNIGMSHLRHQMKKKKHVKDNLLWKTIQKKKKLEGNTPGS